MSSEPNFDFYPPSFFITGDFFKSSAWNIMSSQTIIVGSGDGKKQLIMHHVSL